MIRKSLLMLALVSASLAHAAPDAAAKAKFQAASKAAAAEYTSDKKLCADLGTGNERLQCLKDAKAKYTAAVKTAETEMKNSGGAKAATALGKDEGRVLSVTATEKEGEGSALGVIAGGVAGAVLGNQVGGGTGKDIATIAGAAGGAYAGHKVEQKMKTKKVWTVKVKFADGAEKAFEFDKEPGLAAGDVVKRSGDTVVRR